MELNTLHLTRESWGSDKGKLKGRLSVTTESGEIHLTLTQEKAERILTIVAEQLVDQAKEIAHNLTREILEHKSDALLENKTDE
jgi:hypothetical protein